MKKETKPRAKHNEMFKKFKVLNASGKYTRMGIYQILADEFGFAERNSVYPIILKMEKAEVKTKV